jgi:hypothetical protein
MQQAKQLLQQLVAQHTHGLLTMQQPVLIPLLQALMQLPQMRLGSSLMPLRMLLRRQRAARMQV